LNVESEKLKMNEEPKSSKRSRKGQFSKALLALGWSFGIDGIAMIENADIQFAL
jgi:hypothetical protein